MLEEAKKRDHRKLGKELELFAIIDEIGPGLPLFYPKGAILRRTLENYITELQERRGYVPIWIPHITKGELYKISGHLDKYDAMYPPMDLKDEAKYYLKPMNCPHFMMLYKTVPHSYRELPVRYTCTTTNYRYEKSGELSGLTRVRALTQDDCHVFVRPDQIEHEINLMLDMVAEVYKTFGFDDFWVRISTHDPAHKDKYIGDQKIWADSEATLAELIKKRGWKYDIGVGEAAFYGPKLDFIFKDVIGRDWQLSTIQLDMNLPQRFELEYIDENSTKQRPVVIHRAILGSDRTVPRYPHRTFRRQVSDMAHAGTGNDPPRQRQVRRLRKDRARSVARCGHPRGTRRRERIARQAHPRSGDDEGPLRARGRGEGRRW